MLPFRPTSTTSLGTSLRAWGRANDGGVAVTVAVMTVALVGVLGPSIGYLTATALGFAATALSSYVAMNFTGTSTFTSPTGVEHEMRRALPWQVGGAAVAVALWIASMFLGKGW